MKEESRVASLNDFRPTNLFRKDALTATILTPVEEGEAGTSS